MKIPMITTEENAENAIKKNAPNGWLPRPLGRAASRANASRLMSGIEGNVAAANGQKVDAIKRRGAGTVQVILASLLYGVEPSIHAFALKSGLHATQTITVRVLVALALTMIVCCLKKSRLPTAGRERNELIIAGILGLGLTGILLSSSYQYIPVGMATVVHFLYPSLTCIVSAILMRERMSAFNVIAMVLSIAGLYIIGGKSIEGDLKGVAFAFFSAISFTLYLIVCGKKAGDADQNGRMLFIWCGSLIACVICRLFSRSGGSWSFLTFGIMFICGVLNCTANYLLAAGISHIGASIAAFFCLLEPISSVVFSALLYHNRFSISDICGGALSLSAIVIISMGQLRQERASGHRDRH